MLEDVRYLIRLCLFALFVGLILLVEKIAYVIITAIAFVCDRPEKRPLIRANQTGRK